MPSAAALLALALCGLLGGIGITLLGPGGVLVTIGLYALGGVGPATVAGTAIVTHLGTGALGTAAYLRSGQLREPRTARMALLLVAVALLGTPLGVLLNGRLSHEAFGALLGVCVAAIGLLLYHRERHLAARPATAPLPSPATVAAIGLAVALASGVFGLGGPLLCVPLLVSAGVPMLPALGAAQAQSIVIAATGTVGYAAQGAISWPLALLVGLPELVGVAIGWRLAHSLPTHRLRLALAAALVAIGVYLAAAG